MFFLLRREFISGTFWFLMNIICCVHSRLQLEMRGNMIYGLLMLVQNWFERLKSHCFQPSLFRFISRASLVNYTDGAFLGTEFTLPALLLTPCVAPFIVRSAYKISSLSFPHFCTPPPKVFFFFCKQTIGCKGIEGSLIRISVISWDVSTNKWSLIIMEIAGVITRGMDGFST